MNLNWFETILYGLFSGLSDILPVSAQAHRTLLLKVFGARGSGDLLELLIHLAIIAALYSGCRSTIVRMNRARRLALVPKKKRKRPLDVKSMMDMRMLRTMMIPGIIGLLMFRKASGIRENLIAVAFWLFVNGLILYIPQYLPSGNKDCRNLSRVEGLLMGLGGGVSVIPGISAVGSITSVGSVCSVDGSYCLELALLSNLMLNMGYGIYDVLGLVQNGLGTISAMILVQYIAAAAAAYGAAWLAIRVMRHLAQERNYSIFGFYCFGLSLFVFILNLIA